MAVSLDEVATKVESGERLSEQDIHALESERDIIRLGMLANAFRRKLHGSTVTFVRVADLKLADLGMADLSAVVRRDRANSGETSPKLREGGKVGIAGGDALSMSASTVVPAFRPAKIPSGAGEVRLFQTPDTLDAAVAVVSKACDLAWKTPLSAFCLFELSKFPEGLPVVLAALKSAGLELITQAPLDRLRSPEQALEAASDAGLTVARVTVDEAPDRPWSDVCRQLADIQRKIQSVRVFAPLPRKLNVTQPTTGYEDVKRIALSRLLAENVDTIQVDWELYGPKLAQVALTFGADDFDSVSAEDDDSRGHRRSPLEEIRRNIRAAGFEPAERNGRFERRD